jgi:hypothetical protein
MFATSTRLVAALAASATLSVGCSAQEMSDDPLPTPTPLALVFPDIAVESGQELASRCQSVTLNNTEPLAVHAVHMQAGTGWHHSNWFFVPETSYDGPDGTWRCRDRGFDTLTAALQGGVLYAQSTQAVEETQAFGADTAVIIPPRSKIVGEVHLLNLSEVAIETHINLDIELIALDSVQTALQPVSMTYFDLDLAAGQRTAVRSDCEFAAENGGPLDFRVHYVMPHYHELGVGLTLEAIGGEHDGEPIYETGTLIGEPLGGTLDPPFDLAGASGLRFGCTFDNSREVPVGWGIGDQEMCVLLAFVDSPLMWAAYVDDSSAPVGEEDGATVFEGPCDVASFIPR